MSETEIEEECYECGGFDVCFPREIDGEVQHFCERCCSLLLSRDEEY